MIFHGKTVQEAIEIFPPPEKRFYIRFGGHGIMDGLKQSKAKAQFYKMLSVDNEGLHLKAFRAKRGCFLPVYQWNQECEVISADIFKTLPQF